MQRLSTSIKRSSAIGCPFNVSVALNVCCLGQQIQRLTHPVPGVSGHQEEKALLHMFMAMHTGISDKELFAAGIPCLHSMDASVALAWGKGRGMEGRQVHARLGCSNLFADTRGLQPPSFGAPRMLLTCGQLS